MNLINKQEKGNPNCCKNITNIFYKLTYFFLVVKLSIFELKQLFTLTFSHDAKKYVLKLRTQLVFLRKRRHCLVPVFLGFSRRKKRFASSHLNQPNKTHRACYFCLMPAKQKINLSQPEEIGKKIDTAFDTECKNRARGKFNPSATSYLIL